METMMNPDYVALAVALPLAYLSFKLAKWATPRDVYNVPTVPRKTRTLTGFFFGHFADIIREDFAKPQRRWIQEMKAAHGEETGSSYAYFRAGGRRILVSHPKDLDHIFFKNAPNYVKGSDYKTFEDIIGESNLVSLRDEAKHATQRRLVAPAFNPKTLRDIANTILADQTRKGFDQLAAKSSGGDGATVSDIDLGPVFDSIALGTVAEAAFKKSGMQGEGAGAIFQRVQSQATAGLLFLLPKGLQRLVSSRRRKIEKDVATMRQMGKDIIQSSLKQQQEELKQTEHLPEEADERSELMSKSALIDHLVGESQLSESAMIDHIITFLFAGHETSSKGLLWTAYLLAAHPEKQALLHEELVSSVSRTAIPTIETVKDLNYLSCVVKESLRLYSPIGIIFRSAKQDDVLPHSKAFIPKDTTIVFCSYVTHILPEVYGSNAEQFVPERWAENTSTANSGADRCEWMPFLVGKRNCIGKDFAINELLLVVAALVRRYEIRLSKDAQERLAKNPGGKPRLTTKISVRPKEKITFDLIPRTQ